MSSLQKTIKEVKGNAQQLMKISKIRNQKYSIKKEYLNQIFKKWQENQGKETIHLSDLPDYITIKFNEEGINQLKTIYSNLKKLGLDKLSRKYKINLYILHEYINNKQKSITIKFIKELNIFLHKIKINFSIKKLEKNVITIRTWIKGYALNLKNGFPVKLYEKEWAFIFGVIPDSYPRKFNFYSINSHLLKQISGNLNKIGIKNKTKYRYTGENRIISHLISIGGIDITKKQLYSNNAFPYWFFNTGREFQAILLSKLIDTEGNIDKSMIRIAQSNLIKLSKKELKYIVSQNKKYIIKPSKSIIYTLSFSKLPKDLKKRALFNPPLLLISAQILLMKNKIFSVVYPRDICISKSNYTTRWHLVIQGYEEINKLYEFCKEYIIIHKSKIESYLTNVKIHLPNNLKILYYLSKSLKTQNIKGYFTSTDLAEMTKKNIKSVNNTIGELSKLNLVTFQDKAGKFKKWILTPQGRRYCRSKFDLFT